MTKKIGYSKTYPILSIGVWEKIFIEEEVPVESDTRKVLYELKRQVESFHFESNKADEKKTPDIPIIPKSENYIHHLTKEQQLIHDINTCTEIKVLETYKLIVRGRPELETAYNNRLKELT